MSATYNWMIRIEVKTKDGSSISSEEQECLLKQAFEDFKVEETFFEEDYIDELLDLLLCLEVTGDRRNHYEALSFNVMIFESYLEL
ncbi:MAG TPA: hypothetical protein VM577_09370, partial [Anaerovoracaceae bacterium]|nr:hypothetical protein [Anaerovoracaceae bacterium]